METNPPENEKEPGFRIDLDDEIIPEVDDESPSSHEQDESYLNLPVSPAIISLVAFLVLGALLLAGYFTVNSRIDELHNSIPAKIEDAFNRLGAETKQIYSSLQMKISKLESRVEEINKKIKNTRDSVETRKNYENIAQKELQDVNKRMNEIEKRIVKVSKESSLYISGYKDLEEKIASIKEQQKRTETAISEIEKGLALIKADIDALITARKEEDPKILFDSYKKELEVKLKEIAKNNAKELSRLAEQIDATSLLVKNLEKQVAALAIAKKDEKSPNSEDPIIEQELEK